MSEPSSERTVPAERLQVWRLTCLACLSGCCALAYEVLYMRALTTVLGDMFYVHAALLSTFLVGIALGAKLAYRWFRWLFLLEILTGLFALGFPFLLQSFAQFPYRSSIVSSPSLTILSTVGFLVIPSLLIGFSIPLFSGYLKACMPDRLAFQRIYVAYNLGAVLSVLGVEFLLVRYLGVSNSLAAIGCMNLLIGASLILAGNSPTSRPPGATKELGSLRVAAVALASLASAAFQMFFLQLSYLVFEPHRENFAVAVSVTLFGIFVGARIASRTRVSFATLLVLLPVTLGSIYSLYLPILRLHQSTAPWAGESDLLILAHKFLIGCFFALGPMILFGATLPSLMRSEGEVTSEAGCLLFVSSLANAAGYLAYVLVGHPYFTVRTILLCIAGSSVAASLLATGLRWSKAQALLALGGVALLLTMAKAWDERNFYLAQWVDRLSSGSKVTIFKSGAESATLLTGLNYQWVSYNGHPSIYVQTGGKVNRAEMLSGVIPALGAPRLERALVLGLGTGITAGTVASIFRFTDVVEINAAFLKMAPVLRHVNLDILENPAARVHLSDGRAFLTGKEGLYDAIVNSILAPTYFAASKIYTVEFYEQVKRALKPDGVFCSWLALPEMSEQGILTILSALRENFAYCDLRLLGRGYYMATCSARPIEPRRFDQLTIQKILVTELESGFVSFDLDTLFEDLRLSVNLFDHFRPEVLRNNTDDHPVLEFNLVRSYQRRKMGRDLFLMEQELWNIDPVRRGEASSLARLVQRAAVFYRLAPDYFQRNFVPLFRADPAFSEVWRSAVPVPRRQ